MSAFLYYLAQPKSQTVVNDRLSESVLRDSRLTATLADVASVPKQCVATEVRRGPDGGVGTLLYPVPVHGDLPNKLGYDSDLQHWEFVQIGEALVYWIGWYRDNPPRPADLERRDKIPGWEIQDAYGDTWSIPVARSPRNARGNFPYAVEYGPDHKPVCGVSRRYRGLWDASARLWDLVAAHAQSRHGGLAILGEGFSDDEDAFVLACVHCALQINYRVDLPTCAAYNQVRPGWLTQTTASLMANAIVDMHAKRAWEAAQKKTATPPDHDGSTSTPGDPDESPDTDPAAEN